MGRVSAEVEVAALASAAEELWYDTARWPTFVDGLAHVAKVEGDWPREGRVIWDAKPGGRGRVAERVTAYEARAGQTVAVEDEKLRGTQRVSFAPGADDIEVALELEYELKERNALTPFVDALFIRRALRDSLQRSLVRFARERRADMEVL